MRTALINYEIISNGNVVAKGWTTFPVTGNFTDEVFFKATQKALKRAREDYPRDPSSTIYPTYIYLFEPEKQTP